MKYKYIGTKAQLKKHGFKVESYLKLVHATKEAGNNEIYIILTWGSKKADELDAKMKLLVWNSQSITDDIRPHIQDLIDDGLVEVQND